MTSPSPRGSSAWPTSSRSSIGRAAFRPPISVARERSGTQFDPALVDAFCRDAAELFGGIESATTWDAVIAAEPELEVVLTDEELDAALAAMANFADLKSPYTLGHSCAVAELAERRRASRSCPMADAVLVRRAGFVHDLGRLGVSNAIWDKRGELTPAELERVRLHPYLTERMLASSAALAPLGAVAVQHHERLDGSGYPRGTSGESLTPAGRILAAADTYRAKLEPRPHRRELAPEEAASYLRAEVKGGRLDGDAVDAVLRAAGHPRPTASRLARRTHVAGGRGVAARGARALEPGDRGPARDLAEDGRQPRRAHLREDRRLQPRPGEPVRRAERVDAAGRRGLARDPIPKMRWLPHDRRSLRPYRRMCRIDRRGSDGGGTR